MDNLTLGLFAVIFTALVVTLILVHRENRRIHRLMERERFAHIDNHGVIFEPEPIGAPMPGYIGRWTGFADR